jgi:hypothetical protein
LVHLVLVVRPPRVSQIHEAKKQFETDTRGEKRVRKKEFEKKRKRSRRRRRRRRRLAC